MLLYGIIGVVVISMWTTIGAMMLSGRISHYEDIERGLILPEFNNAPLDAEPATG